MNTHNQLQFAPFNAINQFMLPEYRQEIIEMVLKQVTKLSINRRNSINTMFRCYVKVSGFRNSELAPLAIKIRQSGSAFEQRSDFVAQILSAWFELHPLLAQKIFDLLTARDWELLPLNTDRTILPGFLVRWPKEETYDILDAAFHEKYPTDESAEYDIRLMVVWISGRLPYDMVEQETEAGV